MFSFRLDAFLPILPALAPDCDFHDLLGQRVLGLPMDPLSVV